MFFVHYVVQNFSYSNFFLNYKFNSAKRAYYILVNINFLLITLNKYHLTSLFNLFFMHFELWFKMVFFFFKLDNSNIYKTSLYWIISILSSRAPLIIFKKTNHNPFHFFSYNVKRVRIFKSYFVKFFFFLNNFFIYRRDLVVRRGEISLGYLLFSMKFDLKFLPFYFE